MSNIFTVSPILFFFSFFLRLSFPAEEKPKQNLFSFSSKQIPLESLSPVLASGTKGRQNRNTAHCLEAFATPGALSALCALLTLLNKGEREGERPEGEGGGAGTPPLHLPTGQTRATRGGQVRSEARNPGVMMRGCWQKETKVAK